MKIAVSFLSSKYSFEETINKINESNADLIHVDIMDGIFVEKNNFSKKKIKYLLKNSTKNLDIHLMVKNPKKYLNIFKNSLVDIIYFHPKSEKSPLKFINKVKHYHKKVGIAIDSDEDIKTYEKYFSLVDYILLMSVKAGAGGQKFLLSTNEKIKNLIEIKEINNYEFKISLDGGVNGETIKNIEYKSNIDYVVSGSFICHSDDFKKNINMLK